MVTSANCYRQPSSDLWNRRRSCCSCAPNSSLSSTSAPTLPLFRASTMWASTLSIGSWITLRCPCKLVSLSRRSLSQRLTCPTWAWISTLILSNNLMIVTMARPMVHIGKVKARVMKKKSLLANGATLAKLSSQRRCVRAVARTTRPVAPLKIPCLIGTLSLTTIV